MPRTPKPETGQRAQLAAAILAGGSSSRMGTDKAFLAWEGQPLLQWQIATVRRAGAAEVWIAGRRHGNYTAFHCPVVHDPVEGAGPLAGFVAALRAASAYRWLLTLAVDLPRMTDDYLHHLATAAIASGRGVIPQRGPYFEPLAAIYPVVATLATAEAHLAARRLALQDLAAALVATDAVRPHLITPVERHLFANWNDGSGPSHPL